jgi:hypothetical protein
MPRTAPVCASLSLAAVQCAPRYAPFWYKLDAPTTTVPDDGHWSLATAFQHDRNLVALIPVTVGAEPAGRARDAIGSG